MQLRESKPTVRFIILMSTILFFGICWTILGLLILKNQDDTRIMLTDTLDKINEISVTLEPETSWFDEDIDANFFDDNIRPPGEINPVPAERTVTYLLSPEERSLVERIVMSESGGESLEAQMAVAQTIYDRMHDFGDTLNKAIKTYSQRDNGAPSDSVELAVVNVFDKGTRIYEGGTYQLHDDTVKPYWTKGKIFRGSIGRLSFYGGYTK